MRGADAWPLCLVCREHVELTIHLFVTNPLDRRVSFQPAIMLRALNNEHGCLFIKELVVGFVWNQQSLQIVI